MKTNRVNLYKIKVTQILKPFCRLLSMNYVSKIILILILPALFIKCNEKYTPKPRAYFRITFPEKSYHQINAGYPYSLEIPDYAGIEQVSDNLHHPFWINIEVPANKAEVHLSYYALPKGKSAGRKQLSEFIEETFSLAYKHSIKADAIQEQVYLNPEHKVYGLIFRIEGNAASPFQFFLTDSTNHFLRGALYIREVPNIDSLQPVIDFLEPDIIKIIETTTWN